MNIQITPITNSSLMEKAASFTSGKDVNIKDKQRWYLSEHSPIRTQLFWIEMYNIPTFVSVHLVRHKVGVEHYVRSNRSDRGGNADADRLTPINHAMLINAQALITMARKRLCGNASLETRLVFKEILYKIKEIDESLANCMVPECQYRGRCTELKTCGGRFK